MRGLALRSTVELLSLIVAHSTFGIEFEWLTADRSEPALSYHFLAGAHEIGTPGIERGLSGALADVTQLLRHEGNRRRDDWLTRPAELVMAELRAALLVDFDAGIDPGPHWQQHLRFVALPAGGAFQGWSGFLLETAEVARLIWTKHERGAPVHEQRLAPGELEAVLRDFAAALEERRNIRQSVPPHSGERAVGNVVDPQAKAG